MIRSLKLWIGAGFGAGFLPKFPGTWGSLLALIPIYFILSSPYSLVLLLSFIGISCALNFWVSSVCEQTWGKDPSKMVIDEWAGQGVTFLFISTTSIAHPSLTLLFTGFILFRFFDILKPLGIKKIQNLNAGFGILFDDLLAGFYALISLNILIYVWPNIFG